MTTIQHLRNKPLLELLDRVEREGPKLWGHMATCRLVQASGRDICSCGSEFHDNIVNQFLTVLAQLRKEISEE